MTLKLFNTLSRKKELFKPISEKEVGLYTCGPTVYHYAHIGNLRTYIFEDILKRTLQLNNFKINHVMNITDVGHLTSDADSGEDKMVKGAKREKKTVTQIADFYTQAFQNDLKKLNILSPNVWPKATEHIKEQIDIIKRLEQKGFTYKAGGNVYFNTSLLEDYGKLARLKLDAETKSRVAKDSNKKNSQDFVLWFTKSKFQDQEQKWDSPWGEGYPGWHLECSAMSMKYLGDQFDIHCGGIDHVPVHHTNEIAQSEAVSGKKPWVKYWMHGEFLVIGKNQKMAKSGDNFITISTLEEKGYSALVYRYFCLGTNYRKQLMFSYKALDGSKNTYNRLVEKIIEIKDNLSKEKNKDLVKVDNNKYFKQFKEEINDDLNTSKCLATMWEVVKDESLTNNEKYSLLLKFDQVLGLNITEMKEEKIDIPEEIIKLAQERVIARENKDWKKSDELRDLIKEKGYLIKDSKESYKITKC